MIARQYGELGATRRKPFTEVSFTTRQYGSDDLHRSRISAHKSRQRITTRRIGVSRKTGFGNHGVHAVGDRVGWNVGVVDLAERHPPAGTTVSFS